MWGPEVITWVVLFPYFVQEAPERMSCYWNLPASKATNLVSDIVRQANLDIPSAYQPHYPLPEKVERAEDGRADGYLRAGEPPTRIDKGVSSRVMGDALGQTGAFATAGSVGFPEAYRDSTHESRSCSFQRIKRINYRGGASPSAGPHTLIRTEYDLSHSGHHHTPVHCNHPSLQIKGTNHFQNLGNPQVPQCWA
ncbi:hypothetical protein SODALDRAFT_376362 [Sodiomyces alkalinus F11]|uniref:Uncharacterized protein n=1 Tax=Sodiomyces alkalinus (strain CBS 110278 / VKM F-3762 / F11) TaxID=1314773 RepID=A0A3N2Q1J4_SODAK|nr:hypothetical protein SODALDRAFT_376362 [Sodiomyces alkalinus F11]ROT40576.1 hypothetical protein SODALDRAFT_376362 [Sodiomyces alkalinus F11]